MMKSAACLLSVCLAAGCAAEETDLLERTQQAVESTNRLSFNRLSFNRLSFNRLSFNRLSFNRLSFNRLSFNGLQNDIQLTEDGREALRYVVLCALAEGDMLIVDADGRQYEYPGLFGLAPQWEQQPLDDNSSHWMSACMLAHVNALGVSVPISVRGSDGTTSVLPDAQERRSYRLYEASMFGDLFHGELELYACLGSDPDRGVAESSDRMLRQCADPLDDDGTTACQFISMGDCRDVCAHRDPHSGAWYDCTAANGITYQPSLGVWLQRDKDK